MGVKASKGIEESKITNNRIPLGEFLVGEDEQLFTDPANPETGLKLVSASDKIKHLQKKLQAGKAFNIATRYSNRRPQV